MRISVKVKDIKIIVEENVENTQIKYNMKEITETIKTISYECVRLIKELKT